MEVRGKMDQILKRLCLMLLVPSWFVSPSHSTSFQQADSLPEAAMQPYLPPGLCETRCPGGSSPGACELTGLQVALGGQGRAGKRRPLFLVAARDTMGRLTVLPVVKAFAEAPQPPGITSASNQSPRVLQFRCTSRLCVVSTKGSSLS